MHYVRSPLKRRRDMSASDLKHSLRKFEFPACAKEALVRIEHLLAGRTAPSSKHVDIAMDIISEFVFCEVDRRSGRRGSTLSATQELHLSQIICDYLLTCKNETIKNTIFLSLFGGNECMKRLKILSILASIAVSASSAPALLAVGVWLQQMGCSSPQSLQLVENIIRDHFYLNCSNKIALRSLAKTAPQFLANFITAVTELYVREIHGVVKMPPLNLLEAITSWVCSIPSLCMSAQLNPPALPSGSIPMAAVTPLAGLVHWCALAPLYIEEDSQIELEDVIPLKKMKLEDESASGMAAPPPPSPSPPPPPRRAQRELYVRLHLGVLHSMRAGRRAQGPPTAVNAQHIAALAPAVQARALALRSQAHGVQRDLRLQTCLDRLGQAVQLALSNGCVYGNINSLLASLESLPENRLLRIVIKSARDKGYAQ